MRSPKGPHPSISGAGDLKVADEQQGEKINMFKRCILPRVALDHWEGDVSSEDEVSSDDTRASLNAYDHELTSDTGSYSESDCGADVGGPARWRVDDKEGQDIQHPKYELVVATEDHETKGRRDPLPEPVSTKASPGCKRTLFDVDVVLCVDEVDQFMVSFESVLKRRKLSASYPKPGQVVGAAGLSHNARVPFPPFPSPPSLCNRKRGREEEPEYEGEETKDEVVLVPDAGASKRVRFSATRPSITTALAQKPQVCEIMSCLLLQGAWGFCVLITPFLVYGFAEEVALHQRDEVKGEGLPCPPEEVLQTLWLGVRNQEGRPTPSTTNISACTFHASLQPSHKHCYVFSP